MDIKSIIKDIPQLDIFVYNLKYVLPCKIIGENRWNKSQIIKKYTMTFGRKPDLTNPPTINEKIQWLKLNSRDSFQTLCADKYSVREYLCKFGDDALIPLVYKTDDWRNITIDIIPDYPCIVKCNTGCGRNVIIRDKNKVDIKELQNKCRSWIGKNYYYSSQEWQYKNIKPYILIEKLILDREGHIPNDYKLNYINGKLEFVYCSIDREGMNYRSIYDKNWNIMDFEWQPKENHKKENGPLIPQPSTFNRMNEIGEEIASNFPYVRVDFYESDGKLYYGEITLYHGSGYDTFVPERYDYEYGEKLRI